MLTAPTPPALPPTQITDHYRPSGKLTTVVRTPNAPRAIEMGGSGSIGSRGIGMGGGMGGGLGGSSMGGGLGGGMGGMGGGMGGMGGGRDGGNNLTESILTNPIIKNNNISGNMKSISWDPMLDTNSNSKSSDTHKSTLKNNQKKPFKSTLSNTKSTASEFEKSNDLLGNLDVVDISF